MRPRVLMPPIVDSDGEGLGHGAGVARLLSTGRAAASGRHGAGLAGLCCAAAGPVNEQRINASAARHRGVNGIGTGPFGCVGKLRLPIRTAPDALQTVYVVDMYSPATFRHSAPLLTELRRFAKVPAMPRRLFT